MRHASKRTLPFALAALSLFGVACGGGGGGASTCNPALVEDCTCTGPDGQSCTPGTLGCACAIGGGDATSDTEDTVETDGTDASDGTDPTDGTSPDIALDMIAGGEAAVTFVPTYGDGARLQFNPNTAGDMPGLYGDGELIVMLCAPSDATCESPLWVGQVDRDDPESWSAGSEPDPIQKGFGPTIAFGGLPAGDFLMMIVEDSADSRRLGHGWDDDFATTETAWGGLVSVSDSMRSARAADIGDNPPPEPLAVTLVDGETLDLGTLILGHWHEQDISPHPQTETGVIVLGAPEGGGVRLLDLETQALIPAFDDGTNRAYDFPLVDETGAPIDGSVCDVIPAGDGQVWVIFGGGAGIAGSATLFDVAARAQATTNRVIFPQGGDNAACRVAAHTWQGERYLFSTGAGSIADQPRKGFWYANVTDLATASVTAGFADLAVDPLFDEELAGVTVYEDALLIGTNAVMPGCNGPGEQASCVFAADFDAATGEPAVRYAATEPVVYKGNALMGSVPIPGADDAVCGQPEQGITHFGLTVVPFAKTGQDLLVIGNCIELNMFDLATGDALDFDTFSPGVQGFDASLWGRVFTRFTLGPDGTTLWSVPGSKSRVSFLAPTYFVDGSMNWIGTDRHTLLALDLSAAVAEALPEAKAEFSARNQDETEGWPDGVGNLARPTPALDPGIDIRGFYQRAWLYLWNPAIAGGVPIPVPNTPVVAVAEHSAWIQGQGQPFSGESGLTVGGNLITVDLDAQEVVLWPRDDQPYHRPFVDLANVYTGYDLTPGDVGDDSVVATAGAVYVP